MATCAYCRTCLSFITSVILLQGCRTDVVIRKILPKLNESKTLIERGNDKSRSTKSNVKSKKKVGFIQTKKTGRQCY